MKVVVASRNRHKVREIEMLIGGLNLELVSMDDLVPDLDLVEDEPTFVANALTKAEQAAVATGLPTLADDSGIEVDALGGAPGVRSARWSGEPCDDARNNAKLLIELFGVAPQGRTARYRCAAAYVDRARNLRLSAVGACEGVVLEAPRGSGGFGYDPLFFVPALGKTMAQIDVAEKNRLSHRASAFRELGAALLRVL